MNVGGSVRLSVRVFSWCRCVNMHISVTVRVSMCESVRVCEHVRLGVSGCENENDYENVLATCNVISGLVLLLYVLATCKVISGRVPTDL